MGGQAHTSAEEAAVVARVEDALLARDVAAAYETSSDRRAISDLAFSRIVIRRSRLCCNRKKSRSKVYCGCFSPFGTGRIPGECAPHGAAVIKAARARLLAASEGVVEARGSQLGRSVALLHAWRTCVGPLVVQRALPAPRGWRTETCVGILS